MTFVNNFSHMNYKNKKRKETKMSYLLLILGFVLLIKGADYFVDGASYIASKFHIPPMVVGMTIVAIGTSLPEITISALASLRGENGMAVGNILGSNILNICLILGIVCIIQNVPVKKSTIKVDIPVLLVSEFLLLILGYVGLSLSRVDGAIFAVLFVGFVIYMVRSAKNENETNEKAKELKVWQVVLCLVGGCIAIKFGGNFVVNSASTIAKTFGMSDNLIGLTIVALGTSLPELVTSVVAARKGSVDLALGNCIGSDIFNILLALSMASIINPISFSMENIVDCAILIVVTLITWLFTKTQRSIVKYEGVLLLLFYAGYSCYIFAR